MPTVRDLLARKGADVLVVSPSTTVREAAQRMNDRGVGSVLVMQDGALAGIFTERDLMKRVVGADLAPGQTAVGDVMTRSLVTCTPDATLTDCASMMSERRIRHLPIVDGAEVRGVVTTGDLLANELNEKAAQIQQLESFVFYVRQ